jgi:hypothetical protein
LYDCIPSLNKNATVLQLKRGTHHVIHLVRNVLQPTLHGLYASNHSSNLAADDGLRRQGFSKRLALTNPFQTFLHNPALSTGGARGHHPAFVIEIAGEIPGVS